MTWQAPGERRRTLAPSRGVEATSDRPVPCSFFRFRRPAIPSPDRRGSDRRLPGPGTNRRPPWKSARRTMRRWLPLNALRCADRTPGEATQANLIPIPLTPITRRSAPRLVNVYHQMRQFCCSL